MTLPFLDKVAPLFRYFLSYYICRSAASRPRLTATGWFSNPWYLWTAPHTVENRPGPAKIIRHQHIRRLATNGEIPAENTMEFCRGNRPGTGTLPTANSVVYGGLTTCQTSPLTSTTQFMGEMWPMSSHLWIGYGQRKNFIQKFVM